MSEDLRQKVVEAMARARYEVERRHVKAGWPEWDGLRLFGQKSQRRFAAAALDAALTVLADNAEALAVDPFEVFVAGDGYNSIRPRDGVDVVNQVIDALRSNSSSKP